MIKLNIQNLFQMNRQTKAICLIFIVFSIPAFFFFNSEEKKLFFSDFKKPKLYWFIPDGVRADPRLFNIFKWAEEGKLPNIRKLMQEGAYGYSIPDFPSHTPTNFASLFTGVSPKFHGIADGPMHTEGHPLKRPSVAGFSSTAKWVSPIWIFMEKLGKKTLLLSLPGSTPPELKKGITIRGRWGGWGFDTYKVIFEPEKSLEQRKKYGNAFKLFFIGSKLTRFVKQKKNRSKTSVSYSPVLESVLNAHGTGIHANVTDTSNDNIQNYDKMIFYLNKDLKNEEKITLKGGEWSNWIPVSLKYKGLDVDSHVKIKLIFLKNSGIFRVRVLYNNINKFITQPDFVAKEMTESLGPMVDFADNWPPQLIYAPEDKETFKEEAFMSLDFHKRAVNFLFERYLPDVFIHNIYTPNQMLESRWWMKYIEELETVSSKKKEEAWNDIFTLYKGLDAIIGEAMKKLKPHDIIVFSSDHGICPLKKLVRINNLFAKKGWLKFKIDPNTGEAEIDWSHTKVIYLKMAHVYINPKGLSGNWKRSSGKEYEILREKVKSALLELTDESGVAPLSRVFAWEKVEDTLQLPSSRVGDLVLEVHPPFFWFEEVSEDLKVFTKPVTSGFKQTVDPEKNICIWTPFVIWGKGIKSHYKLAQPIRHRDQLPTIFKAMKIKIPEHVTGRVIKEVFKK